MLKIVSRPCGRRSCMATTSLESLNGTCDHELVSNGVLTSITALHVELSARCEEGYITCHLEVVSRYEFPRDLRKSSQMVKGFWRGWGGVSRMHVDGAE